MASLQISRYGRYVDGLAKIVSMRGREELAANLVWNLLSRIIGSQVVTQK